MVSWLLALLHIAAAAPPDDVVRIPRWERVVDDPESRGTLPDRGLVRLARVPGPEPMRAQCGPRDVPRRVAVLDGALVDGPFSVPVRDESGWVFPPAPEGLGTWLFTPADCDLYRLDDAVTSEAFAHAEQGRTEDEWAALLAADPPFTAEEARWLDPEGIDASRLDRYVALRPGGPHPPGWAWWSGDDGRSYSVRGPRRVRVEARWVGDPRPVCLVVDGVPACQSVGPDERLVLRGGHLARVPEVDEGRAVGRAAAWTVLLPEGPHVLAVDGDALVRLVGTWPVAYTRGTGLVEPESVEVFPDAGPDLRAAAQPDGAPASVVLLGPATTPIAPTDIRWVPLDNPGLAQAVRVDETGVLTLHLLPEGPGPCTVRLPGGEAWRARPREAVQRFLWTGLDDAPGWPLVEGCDARVRVTGLTQAEGAWVAGRWWAANPGGSLSWSVVSPEPRLFLRHPSTQTRPYRVQITHPSGRVDHWTVDPRDVPADRWTAEGGAWQPGLELGLEPGPGAAQLWSEVPLLARVTAIGPPIGPAPVPVPVPAPDAPPPDPVVTDLRALSAAIASAPDDPARAGALLDRAQVFEEQGLVRLAWIDFERAAGLDPALADENPVADRLRRATAALVHGPDRWVPDDPLWVPADAPDGVDARAAVGDWLDVTARLRAAGADPRIWGREAVAAGQIATAGERLDLYEDLVRHTPGGEVEHPWLWPLRVLTGWERLVQVRGTSPQPVAWPDLPSEDPDLFPDAWAIGDLVAIPEGAEVAIPRAGGRTLAARCLTTRLEVPADGCRFLVRTVRGEVVADLRVDGWGTPGSLAIPDGVGTVQVAVRPSAGVRAEILPPAGLPVRTDRTAWPVGRGGTVSFDVLGPTVLRLETWQSKGASVTLTVTATGPGGRTTGTFTVGPFGDARVPITIAGPVEVRVRTSESVWLVPSLRVPRGASRPARDDVAWLRAGSATGAPPLPPPPTLAWTPPTGRPPPNPPLTAYLRAGLGTTDLDDLQPDPRQPTTLGALFAFGVASRPIAETWWLDATVRADMGDAPLLSFGLLTEALVVKRDWRLWVWARGEIVRGVDPLAPMTTAVGALRITADTWPWPRWQLAGKLQAETRGILSGFFDPFVYGDEIRLWSAYKDDHRRSVELNGRVRFFDPPWFDAAGEAWILTNEDVVEPLEAYGAATWAQFAQPGWQVRGGFEIERRLVDDDRAVGFWSPGAYLRGALTLWPDRDIAIQPRAAVRWRIAYEQVEVLFEVRAYLSRDRALRDLSPSRLADAFAHEWHQDRAAVRRASRGTP